MPCRLVDKILNQYRAWQVCPLFAFDSLRLCSQNTNLLIPTPLMMRGIRARVISLSGVEIIDRQEEFEIS